MSNKKTGFNVGCNLIRLLLVATLSLPVLTPAIAQDKLSSEEAIANIFTALQDLDMNKALILSRQLIADYPHYRMAQGLHADLLAIRSGQTHLLRGMRELNPLTTASFQKESKLRWSFLNNYSNETNHHRVLKTSDRGHLIVINARLHRLFLYRQTLAGLKRIDDFYVSLGRGGMGKQKEGDRKTPTGIYLIDGWKADRELPDLYGTGALTLNYPNAWDSKLGRTGDGIWLHGTPAKTYTRSPLASRGCIVLTNPEMTLLKQTYELDNHTPVILVSGEEEVIMPDFEVLTKIQINLQQTEQDAIWSSVSVMRYPGEDDLYYVHFLTTAGHHVEQFWQESPDGQWQAVLQTDLSHIQLVAAN